MKTGIFLSALGLEPKQAIRTAKQLGAEGIVLECGSGDFAPEKLTKTARGDVKDYIHRSGLEISALSANFGEAEFADPADVDRLIFRTIDIINLCLDLGAPIVTTRTGEIDEDTESSAYQTIHEAVRMLGNYAFERGILLAACSGQSEPEKLKEFIRETGSPGVKVEFDPASFVVKGSDPFECLTVLEDLIVLACAGDASYPGEEPGKYVSLGEGDVNLREYLTLLRGTGFGGFVVIEKAFGENRVMNVENGVEVLNKLLSEL